MNEQQWKQYFDDYGETLHFYNDEGEKEITVPEYIQFVDPGIFYKFRNLEKVTFKGLEILDTKTFEKCENLKTIVLEYSNVRIMKNAVKDCSPELKVIIKGNPEDPVISTFAFPDETEILYEPIEQIDLVEVEIDPSEFEIKDGLLLKYKGNRRTVAIPESVQVIGLYAFDRVDEIRELFIPDSVVEIKRQAIYSACFLRKVTIGKGIKRINEKAFSGYTQPLSVTIKANKKDVKVYKHSFPEGSNIDWKGIE